MAIKKLIDLNEKTVERIKEAAKKDRKQVKAYIEDLIESKFDGERIKREKDLTVEECLSMRKAYNDLLKILLTMKKSFPDSTFAVLKDDFEKNIYYYRLRGMKAKRELKKSES